MGPFFVTLSETKSLKARRSTSLEIDSGFVLIMTAIEKLGNQLHLQSIVV